MKLSPARRAAFEILRRVEAEGAYSSSLLASLDEGMRTDDRALCHELVLGVLRRQLWLDRVLEHFANRRIEDMDMPVRLTLRLGLYQLRFLSRIPPSAAVNESVNLVHAARLKSAASFVNGVLRRATREPDYDPASQESDPVEKLALETSHPRWMIERWADAFGFEEAARLARANNDPAPVAFRLTAKALRTAPDIAKQIEPWGAAIHQSQIAPDARRVTREGAASTGRALREMARDGLIYFQDEASQLVAHLLSVRGDDRVLDVCAAPGSKTTHIAALAPHSIIVAGDLYEHRMQLLRQLAADQGVSTLRLIVHDARTPLPFVDASFDRVLVDAPCSGTGTLRHSPEIRWRLKASDIAELSLKQILILRNAAATVRTEGLLVYSTCSVEREENELVIEDFMDSHSNFEKIQFNPGNHVSTEKGAIRTWPHRHDVDGFFIAAFRRRA